MVRVVHYNGIGVRNVDTVFNDCRGKEHVVIVIDEAHDDFLQLLRRHLPMADGHTAVGHILMDKLLYVWQT